MSTWEARMAERAQRRNPRPIPPPMPTDDAGCCYRWKWYGDTWGTEDTCNYQDDWSTEPKCDHEHHQTEVFQAGAVFCCGFESGTSTDLLDEWPELIDEGVNPLRTDGSNYLKRR